jgi:hypothetical protein
MDEAEVERRARALREAALAQEPHEPWEALSEESKELWMGPVRDQARRIEEKAAKPPEKKVGSREPKTPDAEPFGPAPALDEGRLEVRPIGTTQGLKELAALHRKTWSQLNVQEKQVHMLLWPAALHFGMYVIKQGEGRRRPQLIGAFWARCLADAPLTLGHLYPAALFKGLGAEEVFEFGGMVIDPSLQHRGLVRTISDTARLFLFSRRPKLIITNPVEPLYAFYKSMGLKTVGERPVEHPHAYNVKVWLMYGRFDDLAKPYFM